jgi:hypothetical protein
MRNPNKDEIKEIKPTFDKLCDLEDEIKIVAARYNAMLDVLRSKCLIPDNVGLDVKNGVWSHRVVVPYIQKQPEVIRSPKLEKALQNAAANNKTTRNKKTKRKHKK